MSMKIEGYKELNALLKKLPKRLQERAIAGGLRSAAAELAKEARKRITASDVSVSGKKKLRRAIKVKASRSKMRRQGYVLGSVQMVMTGDKEADAYWWRWIDEGTAERQRKSGGATGAVRARKIFRPAFEASSAAASTIASQRIAALARREIEKMAAKPPKGTPK